MTKPNDMGVPASPSGSTLQPQAASASIPNATPAEGDAQWKQLRDQLYADLNRPEGRWGIHGRSAVDDDYFAALEYVVGQMDALLEAGAPNVQPKGTAPNLAVFGSGPFHVETRTNAHAEVCDTKGRAVVQCSWSTDATARANALCAWLNGAAPAPAPTSEAKE